MKIIKAPLRVSLFGGGTDLPEYSDEYGATIVSFAIDRHMYVTWNDRPTGGCRLAYSKVEELETFAHADHTLVRECARRYGLPEPGTLTIVSDVPKGTGLGSSSALSVALCEAAGATGKSGLNLAQTAYLLEREVAPVGWQDHQPATIGGFRTYMWDGHRFKFWTVPFQLEQFVNTNGLLLYTNVERDAAPLLRTWIERVEELHEIRELADHVAYCLPNMTGQQLADNLQATWLRKRRIPGVSNVTLDAQYQAAIDAGALGGKLLGAGGGGCWFFFVAPDKRQDVKDALGLTEIPFRIPQHGVQTFEV